MPGSASSCAAVAVLRLTGPAAADPPAAERRRRRPPPGNADGDLLTVGDDGRQVDRRRVGARQEATGCRDRVRDARSGRQGHQARVARPVPRRIRRAWATSRGLSDAGEGAACAVGPGGAAGSDGCRRHLRAIEPGPRDEHQRGQEAGRGERPDAAPPRVQPDPDARRAVPSEPAPRPPRREPARPSSPEPSASSRGPGSASRPVSKSDIAVQRLVVRNPAGRSPVPCARTARSRARMTSASSVLGGRRGAPDGR